MAARLYCGRIRQIDCELTPERGRAPPGGGALPSCRACRPTQLIGGGGGGGGVMPGGGGGGGVPPPPAPGVPPNWPLSLFMSVRSPMSPPDSLNIRNAAERGTGSGDDGQVEPDAGADGVEAGGVVLADDQLQQDEQRGQRGDCEVGDGGDLRRLHTEGRQDDEHRAGEQQQRPQAAPEEPDVAPGVERVLDTGKQRATLEVDGVPG